MDAWTYSLVIVYTTRAHSPEDLSEIAARVENCASDIRVFIAHNKQPNSVTMRKAEQKPLLVYSQTPMSGVRLRRGCIVQGQMIAKVDQLERFRAAGLPVPKWAVLTPDLRLNGAEWGDVVIVKPLALTESSKGRGVTLQRTSRVRYRDASDYPPDHPGRSSPMLVQQFIDTGLNPSAYRVCTFFGEPLYAWHHVLTAQRPPLDAPHETLEGALIATQQTQDKSRRLIKDQEVLALARRVHGAIPHVPLKGVDILRDGNTGQLYVLECNPGGNVWHFSSGHGSNLRRTYGNADAIGEEAAHKAARQLFLEQFGAFDVVAATLIEKTRELAE